MCKVPRKIMFPLYPNFALRPKHVHTVRTVQYNVLSEVRTVVYICRLQYCTVVYIQCTYVRVAKRWDAVMIAPRTNKTTGGAPTKPTQRERAERERGSHSAETPFHKRTALSVSSLSLLPELCIEVAAAWNRQRCLCRLVSTP